MKPEEEKGKAGPAGLILLRAERIAAVGTNVPADVASLLKSVWTTARDMARRATDDRADAEDVASEVMMTVMEGMEKSPSFLDGIRNLDTFVFASVANRFKDRWRARRVRRESEGSVAVEIQARRSSWGDPEEEFDVRQRRGYVDRAVAALTDRCQEIWHMRQTMGLMPRQIADRLGIQVGTVYSQVNRALHAIRDALEQCETGRGGEQGGRQP